MILIISIGKELWYVKSKLTPIAGLGFVIVYGACQARCTLNSVANHAQLQNQQRRIGKAEGFSVLPTFNKPQQRSPTSSSIYLPTDTYYLTYLTKPNATFILNSFLRTESEHLLSLVYFGMSLPFYLLSFNSALNLS